MVRLLILAFAATILCAPLAHAQDFEEIELPGYWRGGAYFYSYSGSFDQCAASALYGNQLTISVGLDKRKNWYFVFSLADWWGEPDSDLDFRYRFGGGRWVKATGRYVSAESFMVITPEGSDFISRFRNSSSLELEVANARLPLSLQGTTKLTDALRECVASRVPEGFDPESRTIEDALVVGTGIIMSPDGYVLTNNHVIEGCEAVHVIGSGREPVLVSISKTDEENDLALLKSQSRFDPEQVATLRKDPALKYGESVSVFGFPLAGTLSSGGNYVLGNVTALSGLANDERFVQISAPVQPGNSGGPLLDQSGLVVGVVTMRINDLAVLRATGTVPQNINFALKHGLVDQFLSDNKVDFDRTSPDGVHEPTEIAESAIRFSVQVACIFGEPFKDLARLP
jgi:S1-C subfamily serine protease